MEKLITKEWADGTKKWWLNGKFHREDGPAIEAPGFKSWYKRGKHHRKDGPAIEFPDGEKQWWLNGVRYTEKEYVSKMRKYKLKEILN